MEFELEKRAARHLIAAIDDGTLSTSDTFHLVKDADPALVHFVFAWLRATYTTSHPASDAVLGRLGALCTKHPEVLKLARSGASDPLVEWFEDAYSYRDFNADDFVDLVVEKLEG